MATDDRRAKKLVAFCVLMENGEGILSKSPTYILEKYVSAMDLPVEFLENLLDMRNKAKYRKYLKRWMI